MTSLLSKGIQELVLTNEPLPALHAVLVKDCLKEQIPLLTQCEKDIQDLIELLHAKRQQVKQIKQGIRACKRALELSEGTTIFTLPTEILRVIFHHSLPTKLSACFRHPSNYAANPPFTVAQVCRRWRTIALEMPSLWTFFSIRSHIWWPAEVLNAGAESFFDFVKEYFQRSGNLPKSIDVYLPFNYHGEDKFPLNDGSLLQAIFSQDAKIKSLSFGTDNICRLLSKLGLDTSSRPSLINPRSMESVESLVLYSTEDRETWRDEPTRTSFHPSHFKSLRRLSFEPGDSVISDLFLPLPWSNLTHVAINSWIPWRPWLNLFAKLTALQEGIFYVVCNEWRTDPTLENHKALLPDLSNITLIFDGSNGIVLPTYSLPSLKHIRLSAYNHRDRAHRTTRSSFRLHNMGTYLSNLTALSLYHMSWRAQKSHIIEILTLTHNIRSLSLGVDVDYNALLVRLSSTQDSNASPMLVPLLEEFTIDCAFVNYSGPKTYHHTVKSPCTIAPRTVPSFCFHLSTKLVDMVSARWDHWASMGVTQLKKVSLFLEDEYKAELPVVKRGLKWEVKDGLDLTLRVVKKPQTWNDPFNKNMTHWHDGLVFPDDGSEPSSDCATCLREAEELKEKERLEKERLKKERKKDPDYYTDSEEYFPEPEGVFRPGRCSVCQSESTEGSEEEEWF